MVVPDQFLEEVEHDSLHNIGTGFDLCGRMAECQPPGAVITNSRASVPRLFCVVR
jgi:hypothetical protein